MSGRPLPFKALNMSLKLELTCLSKTRYGCSQMVSALDPENVHRQRSAFWEYQTLSTASAISFPLDDQKGEMFSKIRSKSSMMGDLDALAKAYQMSKPGGGSTLYRR